VVLTTLCFLMLRSGGYGYIGILDQDARGTGGNVSVRVGGWVECDEKRRVNRGICEMLPMVSCEKSKKETRLRWTGQDKG